ncbi:hypothetical protein [Microbacterium sp. cx-59]|uniref:hypothetical protein n=1 Tax=Microbacterium sp. cx-59 TaxID=2891207 RepID=UPI001E63A449|nr:hypothetical protein [Microbacterium sp. cx-59]MCC4906935.1 hypothetical protein [Microbacterium sp. cx-59]
MSTENWQRGHWMQTYTGRAFYPLDPNPEDIDIIDIAHSLSMQCRYNGHVDRYYSVAEHCVLLAGWFLSQTAEGLPARQAHILALWALLHDAAEAYIGDMVRPLKLHMPDFCAADDALTAAIATRFGLQFPAIPDVVKAADTRILLDERAELLVPPPGAWTVDDLEPLGVTIEAWDPARAKAEYLSMFGELTESAVLR